MGALPGRRTSAMAKGQKKAIEPAVRDCTINLNKKVHKVSLKKRAPRAVREIKAFAAKSMSTKDVRIDTKLNKFIFSKGIRNVPSRVRVRLSRKRNDVEDPKNQFKGLLTETVQEE